MMNSSIIDAQPHPVNSDNSQPDLWSLVISDFSKLYIGCPKIKKDIIEVMKSRDEFGFNKYGVHIKIKNGRNYMKDALQEALDLSVYIRGIMEENPSIFYDMSELYKDTLNIIVKLYEYLEKEENGR